MKNPLYVLLGTLAIGLAGYAEYRGWSFLSVNEVKNVPRSVRDNPGSYRAIYAGYPRYIGGK